MMMNHCPGIANPHLRTLALPHLKYGSPPNQNRNRERSRKLIAQAVVVLQMGSKRIERPSGKQEAANGGRGQGSTTDLQIHSHNTRMLVGGNFYGGC